MIGTRSGKLLVWDGAAWQPLANGSVDTGSKTVSGATTQLGVIALAGQGAGQQPGDQAHLYLPVVTK